LLTPPVLKAQAAAAGARARTSPGPPAAAPAADTPAASSPTAAVPAAVPAPSYAQVARAPAPGCARPTQTEDVDMDAMGADALGPSAPPSPRREEGRLLRDASDALAARRGPARG